MPAYHRSCIFPGLGFDLWTSCLIRMKAVISRTAIICPVTYELARTNSFEIAVPWEWRA